LYDAGYELTAAIRQVVEDQAFREHLRDKLRWPKSSIYGGWVKGGHVPCNKELAKTERRTHLILNEICPRGRPHSSTSEAQGTFS
jgi:hypothetical protein